MLTYRLIEEIDYSQGGLSLQDIGAGIQGMSRSWLDRREWGRAFLAEAVAHPAAVGQEGALVPLQSPRVVSMLKVCACVYD